MRIEIFRLPCYNNFKRELMFYILIEGATGRWINKM
nr:MAG TPA: hypothetical protein [Bacteriophage sp.]